MPAAHFTNSTRATAALAGIGCALQELDREVQAPDRDISCTPSATGQSGAGGFNVTGARMT